MGGIRCSLCVTQEVSALISMVMHRPHEKALKLRLVVALDEEEAAPEKEI